MCAQLLLSGHCNANAMVIVAVINLMKLPLKIARKELMHNEPVTTKIVKKP